MKPLKFFAYIYYQFKNYYDYTAQAIIVFNSIFMFQMLGLITLYANINHYSTNQVWMLHYTNNYFYDRFFLGTLRIGPIYIATYLCSVIFRNRLNQYYEEFKNESPEKSKKRKTGMITYFVFTVLFLIFSICSSSFF
jgi:hypothetical protein